MNETKRKVIQWIRVSTENQAGDDRASIPAQIEDCKRTCQLHGLEVVKSFEITDVSGASIMAAPEMYELLRLVQDPSIEGVVARDFSRLSRERVSVTAGILEHFQDYGVTLYSAQDGPINPAEFAGMLMGTFRGLMANKERTDLLQKTWGAKEIKRRRGECPSGHITWPFGAAYEKGRGWYYTDEAAKVVQAFDLFVKGLTNYKTLARKLGLPRTSVRLILQNPIYIGWRVYEYKRDQKVRKELFCKEGGRQGDRPKMKRDPNEVIRVQVIEEPLINPKLFHQVQAMLRTKSQRHRREYESREHPFTYNGFLTCGYCSDPIYTFIRRASKERGAGHHRNVGLYYVCRNKQAKTRRKECSSHYMKAAQLESALDDLFGTKFTDRSFLHRLEKWMAERSGASHVDEQRARLQRRLTELESKRNRVTDLYVDGDITRDQKETRVKALDREIEQVNEGLKELTPVPRLSTEALASAFEPFYSWQLLEREDKRRLLAALVTDVLIEDGRIRGMYLQSPNPRAEGPVNATGSQAKLALVSGRGDVHRNSREE